MSSNALSGYSKVAGPGGRSTPPGLVTKVIPCGRDARTSLPSHTALRRFTTKEMNAFFSKSPRWCDHANRSHRAVASFGPRSPFSTLHVRREPGDPQRARCDRTTDGGNRSTSGHGSGAADPRLADFLEPYRFFARSLRRMIDAPRPNEAPLRRNVITITIVDLPTWRHGPPTEPESESEDSSHSEQVRTSPRPAHSRSSTTFNDDLFR